MRSPLTRNLVPFAPESDYTVGILVGSASRPSGFVNRIFNSHEEANDCACRLEIEARAFYETDDLYRATSGLRIVVLKMR